MFTAIKVFQIMNIEQNYFSICFQSVPFDGQNIVSVTDVSQNICFQYISIINLFYVK